MSERGAANTLRIRQVKSSPMAYDTVASQKERVHNLKGGQKMLITRCDEAHSNLAPTRTVEPAHESSYTKPAAISIRIVSSKISVARFTFSLKLLGVGGLDRKRAESRAIYTELVYKDSHP